MLEAGEKEVEMNPNDAPVLAVMAQALARTYTRRHLMPRSSWTRPSSFEARDRNHSDALKPENLTDEAFNNAKNDTLVMAHERARVGLHTQEQIFRSYTGAGASGKSR